MLLCIDIGNTNIKFGLFAGEKMRAHWRISTDREKLADEYAVLLRSLFQTEGLSFSDVSGCAISSVVPALTEVFVEMARHHFHCDPQVLQAETVANMKIKTDRPAEVGPDLITNALAARALYGAPVIVVAFGTATTFTAVSAEGDLEGVAIAPGILTSTESLFRAASMLPRLALAHPKTSLGKDTVQSMRAGIVFGFAALVEGLVNRMKAELGGSPRVVATGGLANLIAPETSVIELVEPDLALIGLRLYYQSCHSDQRDCGYQAD
jgi:type III pantothenate kinase